MERTGDLRQLVGQDTGPKRQISKISILPDTPPPPPPLPKDTKPPPDAPTKPLPDAPVLKPAAVQQPTNAPIKMEGAAGDGPSAFAAGKVNSEYSGGAVSTGAAQTSTSSDRAQDHFFANTARQLLRDAIEKSLKSEATQATAEFSVWISRFELKATGDAKLDAELNAALDDTTRSLKLPAPPAAARCRRAADEVPIDCSAAGLNPTPSLLMTPTFKRHALCLALALALPFAHADEKRELEQLRATTPGLIDALLKQAAAPAVIATPPPNVIRVPYVIETLRAQIRDEIKNEVLSTARKEGWAQPAPDANRERAKLRRIQAALQAAQPQVEGLTAEKAALAKEKSAWPTTCSANATPRAGNSSSGNRRLRKPRNGAPTSLRPPPAASRPRPRPPSEKPSFSSN